MDRHAAGLLSGLYAYLFGTIGSLFFAAAPTFEAQLPTPADAPGRTDLGTTFMQVLCRHGRAPTTEGMVWPLRWLRFLVVASV